MDVRRFHNALTATVFLIASASLGCKRPSEGSAPAPAPEKRTRDTVGDDVKGVARATEKAAKDIGHATVDLADKAGKDLDEVKNNAGADGQDAWITTRVKSELTSDGFDPLHVHVDTGAKIVTLSGTVESAAKEKRAVSLTKAVSGVVGVKDHLFVKPTQR